MSARAFNLDRFRACRELERRGATPGERDAARSAACRIAASAGLSLAEAERLAIGHAATAHPSVRRHSAYGSATPAQPSPAWWPRPKPKPARPMTLAEVIAAKAAEVQHRKDLAAREQQKLHKQYAKQEAEWAEAREAQAHRDREWAELRKRRTSEGAE